MGCTDSPPAAGPGEPEQTAGDGDSVRESLGPHGRGAAVGCGSKLDSCKVHPKTRPIPLLLPS